MITSIIVAMGNNRVIGVDNQLPWHLSADLKFFKAVTMAKPIIMGRKTYESIGRPLPGRTNIVITRNEDWSAGGVTVVHSLDEAVKVAEDEGVDEAMVIGGAQIYAEAMSIADRLFITEVDSTLVGDAYFPKLSIEYKEISRESHAAEGDNPAYAFVKYER